MWLAPGPAGCQALCCVGAASHWWVDPHHVVAGCRAPGGPGASCSPLVSRAGFWVGVCSARGPRYSVSLLVGRTSFLTLLDMGSMLSQSWYWPTAECSWILGRLTEGSKVSCSWHWPAGLHG